MHEAAEWPRRYERFWSGSLDRLTSHAARKEAEVRRKLTCAHSKLHDEQRRRLHEQGWTGSLDKLEARFAAGPSSEEKDRPTPWQPTASATQNWY
jgi:hypothetical protein